MDNGANGNCTSHRLPKPSRSAKEVHKRREMQELSCAIGIQILKFVKTGIYYFDYHTSGKNVTSQNTVLKMHRNF